jgi:tetratricopeptide (TPR) repeat protein
MGGVAVRCGATGVECGGIMKRLFSFRLQLLFAILALAGIWIWQSRVEINQGYFNKADLYYVVEPEVAEAYYLRGLDFGDGDADVYYRLGFSSLQLAHYARAAWAMQAAIEHGYSHRSEAYVYLGAAQRLGGDAAAALETYEHALNAPDPAISDATRAQLYSGRGWSVAALKGCEAAWPDFERALELDPTLTEAQLGLEQCPPPA